MEILKHPEARDIEGIKSEHWFKRSDGCWYATVYDEQTGQEYDVRQVAVAWNVNDDDGVNHLGLTLEEAIESARKRNA